jgi:Helix-turn-helix
MSAIKFFHAALTGDIVNSTQLTPEMEKALIEALERALSLYLIEFYRGDSFQVYMKDPEESLRVALLCRALAISLTAAEDEPALSDIRISIGIGTVITPVRTPGTARGEAFLLSGRRFDEIQQTDQRLSIVSGKPIADIALEVMADYIDAIYKGMTAKQADAIARLLEGRAQQEVAQELNKSKSTVSQLVSAGRWPEIEKIIQQFKTLINQLA